MALYDDSVLMMLLDVLHEIAEEFKSTFDTDIDKCLTTLNSKILALESSGPKSNDHDEFTRAKYGILVNMKELFEEVEREQLNHLADMKKKFLKEIELFLREVQLPVLQISPRSDANSNSPYSVHPNVGSNHKSTQTSKMLSHKSFQTSSSKGTVGYLRPMETEDTQSSRSQPLNHSVQQASPTHFKPAISRGPVKASTNQSTQTSSLQDTVRHLRPMEAEDTQSFRSQPLNHSVQQAPPTHFKPAISRGPVKASTNQAASYSTTNASNATSLSPLISNQSSTYCPLNAPNETAQIPIPGLSYQPGTSIANTSNATSRSCIPAADATDQDLIPGSQPKSVPALQSPRKKYSCSQCPKSYEHKSVLGIHMRKHTGEKPFVCKYCGKKFPYQGAQKNHENRNCKKRPRTVTCGISN